MSSLKARCNRCNTEKTIKERPQDHIKCRCGAVMQVFESYILSPEELAKYRALPAPERKGKQPIEIRSATRELENRRPPTNSRLSKEESIMPAIKEGPDCGLTKEILIEEIAKGETLSSIERAWGMKYNTIHNWVKKWGLKGINQERAQGLLDDYKPIVLREKDARPNDAKIEVYQKQAEMLQKEKSDLQAELEKLRQENSSFKGDVDRLIRERDEYRMAVDELSEQSTGQDELLELLNKTKTRLNEVEKECAALALQIEEMSAAAETMVELGVLQEPSDPVNHPDHYNQGGIECIDAIEAATSGLSGPEAYSTGAAIKYLWRWKWKNGKEDLQKAAWYIKRLIGE